jgi:hypothetical protein
VVAILVAASPIDRVYASATAQVHRLQMPVWIERLGQRYPLRPGMELQENDVLETGISGRAWIRFSDDSLLKIGSTTRMEIDNLNLEQGSKGILEGILRLVNGVFRYTAAPSEARNERNLGIRLATMTLGIRGTDLWGRQKKEGGLVCLIEGKISVQPNDDKSFEMNKALTYANVSKSGKAGAIESVEPEQLHKWAAETELVGGAGLISTAGTWVLNLVSYRKEAAVLAMEQRLQQDGFAVEHSTVKVKGQIFYRLNVPNLESRIEALALAKRMKKKYNIRTPWIQNRTP